MKNYELTYLISINVSEEELKNLSENIKSFIQEEEGAIKKTIQPFKTNLAITSKSKNETQSFLTVLNFSLSPGKIANLEKKLKAENQILRYIILNKDLSQKQVRPRRINPKTIAKELDKPLNEQSKSGKVELKEIDEKIEEILNE